MTSQVKSLPQHPSVPSFTPIMVTHGLNFWDEGKQSISKSEKLTKVKSIKAMDAANGFSPQQDDSSVLIDDNQIIHLEAKCTC